jgi:hypothetical protein
MRRRIHACYCMACEEEDTCMNRMHAWPHACMSYEEEDTCMAYEKEEDSCISYEEEDTCTNSIRPCTLVISSTTYYIIICTITYNIK